MSRLDQSIAEHNRAVETMAALLITVRGRLTPQERELASDTLRELDANCILSDVAYENIEKKS
jgi:hypothetical protein